MKLKAPILCLGVLLGLVSSCQKEEVRVAQPQATAQQGPAAIRLGCTPENKENRLDSVGLYHNLGVEYVEAHAQENSFSEVVRLANEYSAETFQKSIPNVGELLPSEDKVRNLLSDSTSFFAKTIERLEYSDACKKQLLQLNDIVRRNVAANASDYCTLKNAIMKFEAQAVDNRELSEKEQELVLRSAAVARYSAYHWMGLYGGEERAAKSPALAQKKFWEWCVVIGADIAGEFGGGPGMAVACSVGANEILKN